MRSKVKDRVQIRIAFSNLEMYFNLSLFIKFHKYYHKIKCFGYSKIHFYNENKEYRKRYIKQKSLIEWQMYGQTSQRSV